MIEVGNTRFTIAVATQKQLARKGKCKRKLVSSSHPHEHDVGGGAGGETFRPFKLLFTRPQIEGESDVLILGTIIIC